VILEPVHQREAQERHERSQDDGHEKIGRKAQPGHHDDQTGERNEHLDSRGTGLGQAIEHAKPSRQSARETTEKKP
jgi:hypothetical protein